jgi:hypothetical protein
MSLSVIFYGFLYHPTLRRIMDASVFLSHAKKALGDKAWSVDLVLHVGADLAQAVNSLKNLSGKDKSELVCQTILKLLDDGEMAEKEHAAGSTEKVTTKVPWDDCRRVVKTLLPVSLELIVKASRGEISLLKETASRLRLTECFSRFHLPQLDLSAWIQQIRDFLKARTPSWMNRQTVQSVQQAVQQPLDRLSEVRELVLRVEKMLKEAQALPEVKSAQRALQSPTPEPTAVLLPGELPIHVEVSDAQ